MPASQKVDVVVRVVIVGHSLASMFHIYLYICIYVCTHNYKFICLHLSALQLKAWPPHQHRRPPGVDRTATGRTVIATLCMLTCELCCLQICEKYVCFTMFAARSINRNLCAYTYTYTYTYIHGDKLCSLCQLADSFLCINFSFLLTARKFSPFVNAVPLLVVYNVCVCVFMRLYGR